MARRRQQRARTRLTGADRLVIAVGVLSLIAAIVVVVSASGFTASVIAAFLFGLAATAFVALAFLLVGESEDRDRGKGTP
jgi:hypothetical protein